MEIHERAFGGVTILDLSGNLTIGRGEENLRQTVIDLLAAGRNQVLVNLSDVPAIDSSGIGALIKAFTSVNDAKGKLKLLKPSRLARHLLSITGLLSILETYDDETSAVASF
jgi:anti-sigma B factor antagonist